MSSIFSTLSRHISKLTLCSTCIGNYAQGIEDCNEVLRVEPTCIRSYLLRGTCKCKLNQFVLAISDFTKAIHIDRVIMINEYYSFYRRVISHFIIEQ